MSKCSFCNRKAIYKKGNIYYCKEHFIKYFENKVLDTIRKYKLIRKGDRIGVAVSGGKDSISLLFLLNKYKDQLGIKELIGIHINEGIKGYRDILTKYLLRVSEKIGVEIKIYNFKDFFSYTLDEVVKKFNPKPCAVCGVWRRWIMNYAAKELNLDKLATAHNLNDESQTIILNILENNIKDYIKGGIITGVKELEGFVTKIKPFYFITEKETTIYALLNKINPPFVECPYIRGQLRDIIRKHLYDLESKYPGTMESIVLFYLSSLEKIRKYFFARLNIKINSCKYCGFPTSRSICKACEYKLMFSKNDSK